MDNFGDFLIVSDLDGTLLNDNKKVSDYSLSILKKVHDLGVKIVPCSGRPFVGMPEELMKIGVVDYVITCNGASIIDVNSKQRIYADNIPVEKTNAIFKFIKNYNTFYDCYVDDWGYVNEFYYDNVSSYCKHKQVCDLIRRTRTKVVDLQQYAKENKFEAQKIQLFFTDQIRRKQSILELKEKFKDYNIESSIENNIEINVASKGKALSYLVEYLKINKKKVIVFGDNGNDITLFLNDFIKVAVDNAVDDIKNKADYLTLDNNKDGVADFLYKTFIK